MVVKILNYSITLILLLGSGYFVYDSYIKLCNTPITYSIGNFDSRFNITQNDFLKTIREAEEVWENKTNEQLFIYNPSARFRINLIFDERQEGTVSANKSESMIEGSRSNYDLLVSRYNQIENEYKARSASYNNDLNKYKIRADSYNQRVADINKKGGASQAELKELEDERIYLKSKQADLDNEREGLNSDVIELNDLGGQINKIAKELNIKVEIHNKSFGQMREFDQGEYNRKEINIYQFDELSDLKLVLAHELGHALGIDHVENSKSIMYYLMGEQNISNLSLSAEDFLALQEVCKI
mgnify:CR=1 FL=1